MCGFRTFAAMTLSEYLAQPGHTSVSLAARIGVSHSTVLRWASGEVSPPLKRLPEIERATSGAVRVSDFLDGVAQ